MPGAGFVVIPVYAELLKFCIAAQQGKDAPGIKPEAIQVILDALEENKGIHQLRANADDEAGDEDDEAAAGAAAE